ncbi:hypothetical protein SCLCIDRAFT_33816 [Scleroderma citrinum Foug A]|uniref:Uncharacterized protein n=1 Tax=Scleroderma citrinum Foug A TaxID=1036808 RepID=A0A0C3CQX9_9AGAM|nr:hypothetical protein SCLCIDRAFT_33816 [Scleroderma citrinum Foug A]
MSLFTYPFLHIGGKYRLGKKIHSGSCVSRLKEADPLLGLGEAKFVQIDGLDPAILVTLWTFGILQSQG